MKKNIDIKKKAREYIEFVVKNFCDDCNLIQSFSVTWKEGVNDSGGNVSIEYVPEMFNAHFYLYDKFLDTLNGLTIPWKTYVMQNIAHEIGHCYIWELEGTQRDIQKVSTLVGNLFLDSWEANNATTNTK